MTIQSFLLFQTGGLSGLFGGIMPFLLIFGVFYFLIIVPQRRRQKALQDTVAQIKAGDRIVTSGGILATVTAVREKSLVVRSADKSILEITRGAVSALQEEEEKAS